MTKLSKTEEAERTKHVEALKAAQSKLEDAVTVFNAAVTDAFTPLSDAKDEYNAAVTAAEEWRSDIANSMDEYYDNRSEKWQEGEKGEEYSTWKDAWSDTLEEIELDAPDAVELEDIEHPDTIKDLPAAPGE